MYVRAVLDENGFKKLSPVLWLDMVPAQSVRAAETASLADCTAGSRTNTRP
jgi:hypothetical protein